MRRIVALIAPGVLVLASVCSAQDSKPQDLADMSIEQLTQITVYSASKHEQSVSDAPSSVTVITADEIQRYGYRTLADILETVRGFYITSDRYQSYVGVRGFGRLGDWNSRILLLVDGHRINDDVLGQAFIGSEFPVDIDLIQRIEIIRGPSSSLYGAEAFFGVINVITRKENQPKREEISFAAGSFGSYGGRATWDDAYKGAVFALSGSFYSSAGPTLFFPEFDSPATNDGVTGNTNYESYQRVLGTVSWRGFTLQGVYNAQNKGVPTAYFDSLFNDPRTRNLQGIDYLDLRYATRLRKTVATGRADFPEQKHALWTGGLRRAAGAAGHLLLRRPVVGLRNKTEQVPAARQHAELSGRRLPTTSGWIEFNLDPDVSPVATKVSAKSVILGWIRPVRFSNQQKVFRQRRRSLRLLRLRAWREHQSPRRADLSPREFDDRQTSLRQRLPGSSAV